MSLSVGAPSLLGPEGILFSTRRIYNWNFLCSGEVICDVVGGHLVEIETADETNYLAGLLRESKVEHAWIGLEDFLTEGDFRWASAGAKPTYTNWDVDQPDDHQQTQDCVQLINTGVWRDGNCAHANSFICETS
ncbi:hypothetical protein BaRGS_00025054 [Batillaria attramentaria]|uniref:C-type lectin domain-containing protein n=1 Tax=Batillaria attramentaria TaxID=370345 RepID=A0ABD0K9G1_9CAEN